MERAYAKIEKGIVRLGNAWLERRWSTFFGTTTELLRMPEGGDALARRSPEFHVDFGGRPLAAPDLGDIHWSETCTTHGAGVTLELSGPGVAVQLETLLFHDVAGMVRTLSVTNRGAEPAEVTRAAADVLPLDPARYQTAGTSGQKEISARVSGKPLHYAVLSGRGESVLMGASRETDFALFHPHVAYCAPVWRGSVLIPPGKTWQVPPVSLVWVFGGAGADTTGPLAKFHAAWESRYGANGLLNPTRN